MRRPMLGTLSVVVCLGLGTALCPAQEPDEPAPPPAKGSWFSRWLGLGKAPAHTAEPAPEKPAEAEAARPATMVESAAALRAREQAALFRRQAVCLKLQEIADQTNDEALRRKADQLDQRAWSAYQERTAHLPSADLGSTLDEQTLQKHLGSAHGNDAASAASRLSQRTAEGSGRAAAREEQP